MALDSDELDQILGELNVLRGARIQNADLIDPDTLILSLRRPGLTVRVCFSSHPKDARVHVISDPLVRRMDGGSRQRFFRRRLLGRTMLGLERIDRGCRMQTDGVALELTFLGAEPAALALHDNVSSLVAPPGSELSSKASAESLDFPVSRAIEERHREQGTEREHDDARRAWTQRIRKERKKVERLLENLENDAARLELYLAGGTRAEMLKSQLHQVQRGQDRVRLMDWSTGEMFELPLDPRCSPAANLERLFQKAKKAGRGLAFVRERMAATRRHLEALDASLLRGEDAEDPETDTARLDPKCSDEPLKQATHPARKHRVPEIEKIARRYRAEDGTEIWVGRTARDNDQLTSRLARGHELWLHASGLSGAHVLVRSAPGKTIAPETLLDAASLAVYHSKGRMRVSAEVLVTEVRNVRKQKGAPKGQVSLTRFRALEVDRDEARLNRLLGKLMGKS
jgi:predicted ribosome quality control (RQC) complex YloA/Tae2 family protein